ncbi:ralBP1-associated Eps domain-containing protein 1 isoform X1 [Anastrepha obliqua]|uniref:ralBP1-associated Eps domain-containing protein 1 isoform X1 n=1 Tax=Anastrepha obliqua TaxID=95512 RepID=UPI00240A1534|nr:ralBP1-associated Eps domain-containing protein 1 isoform X1 [Anastrepha obliqua]
MEVYLNETESRYFSDLFLCCDVEKVGKIPMLKAMELYRSANIQNDIIKEVIALVGISSTALHISRGQFYSCLKLIAAYQAGMQLRQEIIVSSIPLPLPRFSWKDSPSSIEPNTAASGSKTHQPTNGSNSIPPPPVAERKNSLTRRPSDWQVEGSGDNSRKNSAMIQPHFQKERDSAINSDVPSTDSEVDQNESSCGDGASRIVNSGCSGREIHRHRGSPEAWSTNSDSPTPTNSVTERQWAKETLWQGLLGEEHRQLLGTEEESSDRHSSEDENESDLESVYQITPEQRDYYYKQFKAVQHDINGLLSGQIARVFFEKSRIPVEELRHIWQLCDVTRDGALSLAEFTAAMHLVVLRRNNIPLPGALPSCLHPTVLQHSSQHATAITLPHEPPEADLLHLNDDDEEDKTDNTIVISNTTTGTRFNDKNVMNISTLSSSSQASTSSRQGNQAPLTPPSLPPHTKNRSISNSPIVEPNATPPNLPVEGTALTKIKDRILWGPADLPPTQWTKFTESPTSNVSSPGPKPVNFDMQRTAQAVVSDPQILHPVPLRVTPVAGSVPVNAAVSATETLNTDGCDMSNHQDASSKQVSQISTSGMIVGSNNNSSATNMNLHNREPIQNNDLRAIQRPQAKKLPTKNIGALPPPPQRESSISSAGSASGITNTSYVGSAVSAGGGDCSELINSSQHQQLFQNKKDPPPLPPPRPHRHGRSSSLDLNKFKICAPASQQSEMTAQASFDLQTSTGFADFTHFSGDDVKDTSSDQQQYSLPPVQPSVSVPAASTATVMPPTRFSLQQSNQRISAFEVYRKPNTLHSSQSPIAKDSALQKQPYFQSQLSYPTQPTQPPPPMPTPFGALGAAAIAQPPQLPNADLYEKRVNAISETLRHVSFKQENNMSDILRHLREQNNLLLHLCNDLSDELLSVQTRKEELRLKMETLTLTESSTLINTQQLPQISIRTSSSISAPVTANVTGGSGSSGVHSNV